MLTNFNVLTEPWIPIEDFHGHIKEYGILEALEKAHELQGISDSSPLFHYSMYRLLIAFLTDALRPQSVYDLLDIYDAGKLPMKRITQYIKECEVDGTCFDLFDPVRPFLQSAWDEQLDSKAVRSVALLVHDLPSGNNAIHFDHRLQDTQAFSPQICARALCAVNVFCTSGLQGPSGINGAPPWYVLVSGKNLLERLIYNIWIPVIELPLDVPPVAWRNGRPVKPGEQVDQTSYLYGLTWQARRVCLLPGEGGTCTYSGRKSSVLVRKIAFQKGWKFEGHRLWRDPHVPRIENERGISTVKPKTGRAAWRDLGPLMLLYGKDHNKARYYRPEVIQQYQHLAREIERGGWVEAEIYGIVTNQAKYISWIQDRLGIDYRLVADETRAVLFQNELTLIETVNFELKRALKGTLAPAAFCEQAETIFLGQIRPHFLGGFQEEVALADVSKPDWRESLKEKWRNQLKKITRRMFEEFLDKLGTTAGMLERAAKARRYFYSKLNKLLKTT